MSLQWDKDPVNGHNLIHLADTNLGVYGVGVISKCECGLGFSAVDKTKEDARGVIRVNWKTHVRKVDRSINV